MRLDRPARGEMMTDILWHEPWFLDWWEFV
jgi:hypothetical protein